jgi:hypothetical protein
MITIKIIKSISDPSGWITQKVDYVPHRRCQDYAPERCENARVILLGRALSPEIAGSVIPRDGDEIIFVNSQHAGSPVRQAV